MNPYIIEFDNFSIKWYSVLILVGVILGISMVKREGKRFEINGDFLFNMAFWTIIIGFLGARIYYVLFNYNMYKGDLLSIFKIWEGGLAIHGGIIAGVLTMAIYCKRYNMNFIRVTDLCVPALILAQAIGRWGNFFNGEAHGAATSLEHLQNLHIPNFIIEGMNISGIYYEPTFLYESIACLIGFIILLIVRRLKYVKVGTLTSVYLMYYGIVRFFIETMRTDSLMLGGFRAAQIVSIAFFLIGLISFMIISRKGKFEDLYNTKYDQNIRF